MAISFIKNAGSFSSVGDNTSDIGVASIITSACAVDTHLFMCAWIPTNSGDPSHTWITDTGSNTWQLDSWIRNTPSPGQYATIFSCKITTELAVSDTVTLQTPVAGFIRFGLLHFSGIALTNWFDQFDSDQADAVTSISLTTPTLSQADEMWIFMTAGANVAGTTWSEDSGTEVHVLTGASRPMASHYGIVAATTAITTGGNWASDEHDHASVIATYKAAGGGVVSATASLPVEAQANRSAPIVIPLEAQKKIANTATAPYEATQSVVVTTTSLPAGNVGMTYEQTLTASGGTPPYTWEVVSGSLPAGLTLTEATGVISGTPTTPGIYNFTVRVTALLTTDDQALSITIQAATAWPPPPERVLTVPYGVVGSS